MNAPDIDIEIAEVPYGSVAYQEITALRRAILRAPLELDFTPEELACEHADTHLAAVAGGRVVGTLLLRAVDGRTARLMRMAVEEGLRGRAVGRRLVEHAETLLRSRGTRLLMMHARCTAVGFYEKCGYLRVGGEFLEQRIPHVRMEKRL